METIQEHATSPKRLVSIAEGAQTLGVSTRFLRVLQSRGSLRVIRLGRRVMIAASELDRLVSEGAK
jgi:excisionase family DNA binding protein